MHFRHLIKPLVQGAVLLRLEAGRECASQGLPAYVCAAWWTSVHSLCCDMYAPAPQHHDGVPVRRP